MSEMSLFLDVATILIVFFFVFVAAKQGFAATIVRFAGYLASVILSAILSRAGATLLYQKVFRPSLLETLTDAVAEYADLDALTDSVQDLMQELPAALRQMLDVRQIENALEQVTGSSSQWAGFLVDTVAGPTVLGLTQSILFLLLFAICMIVVRMLSSFLKQVKKIPVIGPMNSFLGGAVGFLEAVLFLFILMLFLELVFWITDDSWTVLNRQVIQSTVILRNFFEYNPISFGYR